MCIWYTCRRVQCSFLIRTKPDTVDSQRVCANCVGCVSWCVRCVRAIICSNFILSFSYFRWSFPTHPTHQPTHPTQFAHTLWLLTVSGLVRNWHPRMAHTITHSWKNKNLNISGNGFESVLMIQLVHLKSWLGVISMQRWPFFRIMFSYPGRSVIKIEWWKYCQ